MIGIIVVFCTQAMDGWMADIVGLNCEVEDDEEAILACYGASAFVRLSFTLLVFHILMLLVMGCRN